MDYKGLNTTALAYIGDSVYEVYVRKHILEEKGVKVDVLHKFSVKYVCAEGEERALKSILDLLTDEESSVVRRARNHKLAPSKKNSKKDVMTDKYATAFEALIGYLYLADRKERMEELIVASFLALEEEKANE